MWLLFSILWAKPGEFWSVGEREREREGGRERERERRERREREKREEREREILLGIFERRGAT
jgi:hypothetical protein